MTQEEFTAFLKEAKDLEARQQRLLGKKSQVLTQLKTEHGVDSTSEAKKLWEKLDGELKRMEAQCEQKIETFKKKWEGVL